MESNIIADQSCRQRAHAVPEGITGVSSSWSSTPQRHPDFWFDDGNIILLADDLAFRVHACILARDSPVFRDLFQVPQEATQEKLDDCPIVPLYDSPDDVSALVSILYGGHKYFHPDLSMPFCLVASLVRLGHKYQMKSVEDGALARLKSCFPSKFDNFQYWQANASPAMTMSNDDAVSAVNFARLTETYSILPTALLGC